jgi:hypothetical protein
MTSRTHIPQNSFSLVTIYFVPLHKFSSPYFAPTEMVVGAAAAACCCGHLPLSSRFRYFPVRAVNSREAESTSSESEALRLQKLVQLDEELRRGDDKVALSLARDFLGQPGGLQCFGAARQVLYQYSIGCVC